MAEQENALLFKVEVRAFGQPQETRERVLRELERKLRLTFGGNAQVWAISRGVECNCKEHANA